MGIINFDEVNAIYFEWNPPELQNGSSFVYFNALTGDHETWENYIAPQCRKAGYGTLVFNYRGQKESPFSTDKKLSDKLIISDALHLLNKIQPPRPILVGLSIGGLFAAQTILGGFHATGLALISTLRLESPRLKWINDALVRVASVGGLELLRDLYLPLLMGEAWMKVNRSNFLNDEAYQGMDPNSGPYKLLSEAGRDSEWAIPWEKLKAPVRVITGLQDRIFYNESDVSNITSRIRSAKRIDLPDAGHLIPAEYPVELTDLLLGFAGEV